MKIRGSNGRAASIPVGLATGAAVSVGITAAGASVTAWMILSGNLRPEWAGYCSVCVLLLSAAAGAAVATSRIQRLRGQMALAAGGIYYLCLMLTTALFFGGQYQGMGVTALVVFGGSTAVILLAPGRNSRGGHRRRKIK